MKELGLKNGRYGLRTSTAAVALGTGVLLAGCATGASPAASGVGDAPAVEASRTVLSGVFTASQAARGNERFQQTCSSCHSPAEFSGPVFQRIWDGRSVGELYGIISTMMPQNDPGSLSPQEYTDIITFFLDQNDYPEGERELPAEPAILDQLLFRPAE